MKAQNHFNNSKQNTEAFIERRKQEKVNQQKEYDLTIKKTEMDLMKKFTPQELEDMKKGLKEKITQIKAKDIINVLLEGKTCPILANKIWDDCNDHAQGEEEQCKNGRFIECSAYNKYINHQIASKLARGKKNQNEEKLMEKQKIPKKKKKQKEK